MKTIQLTKDDIIQLLYRILPNNDFDYDEEYFYISYPDYWSEENLFEKIIEFNK